MKKETKNLEPADAIVVLGYPSLNNGKISPLQKSRVDIALELLKNGLSDKLVFTGGAVRNEIIEAETMKTYALKNGANENQILLEIVSSNTEENAEKCFQLLETKGIKNIILITSTFHTKRAAYLFEKYDWMVMTKAAPYPKEFGTVKQGTAIVIEYLGFARYLLKN